RHVGIRDAAGGGGPRAIGELAVLLVQPEQLVLVELLEVDEHGVRTLLRTDDLVELEVQRLVVAVLRRLDEEDHQERDDRRAGVDHELPGVAIAEERAGKGTYGDEENGPREARRARRE